VYVVEFRDSSKPKRFLTLLALICTLLYFCHAWFFMAEDGHYGIIDVLYLFCNLSAYPVFYCYVLILTKDVALKKWLFPLLLPALVLSAAAWFTGGNEIVLSIGRAVFALEVILVAVKGFAALEKFDKDIRNYYSDTEGKTMRGTTVLLVCLVAMALLSSTANIIGRGRFLSSSLLGIPSLVFSSFLFALFHISFKIDFYAKDFCREIKDTSHQDDLVVDEGTDDAELAARIAAVMDEQKLYLTPGLKISDVALAVGSNRTYVSNAINNVAQMPFSDYVNSRRIEHAKMLMSKADPEAVSAVSNIAMESGFASFPSFYRAFVKYVGMSPTAWQKAFKG